MSRVALAPNDVASASDVGESAGQPSSGREKLINETGRKGTSHKRSFINVTDASSDGQRPLACLSCCPPLNVDKGLINAENEYFLCKCKKKFDS